MNEIDSSAAQEYVYLELIEQWRHNIPLIHPYSSPVKLESTI